MTNPGVDARNGRSVSADEQAARGGWRGTRTRRWSGGQPSARRVRWGDGSPHGLPTAQPPGRENRPVTAADAACQTPVVLLENSVIRCGVRCRIAADLSSPGTACRRSATDGEHVLQDQQFESLLLRYRLRRPAGRKSATPRADTGRKRMLFSLVHVRIARIAQNTRASLCTTTHASAGAA